ncbi:MAG: SirB2 family protein [Proteobacteria bacterium]|nr:SirB2 family protein [Pseudomonadota bacterium]
MLYAELKMVHVTSVILSGTLFGWRAFRLARSSGARTWGKGLKVAPHIVDTVLLLSGVSLAILSHQYPFVNGWLTAKILALLLYILVGKMALDSRTPTAWRGWTAFMAMLIFVYIIGVAWTRDPWSFLSFVRW